MFKKAALIFVIMWLLCATPSFAATQDVLGLATSNLSIPPTVEGPGFLLPDSPFYFLDGWKQQVRLFFAFGPEAKAIVYNSVAGERLAELRFMLLKHNAKGAEIALDGLRENSKNAAESLNQAHLMGQNVNETARTLNTSLKERLTTLDGLERQAKGEMQAAVHLVTATLVDAKSVVEDSLPVGDLAGEVQYDADRVVFQNLSVAQTTAEQLKTALNELQKQASDAAAKSQINRAQALQNAVQEQQDTLQKLQKTGTNNKWKLQADAVGEAQRIILSAQKAGTVYAQSKQAGESAH